MARLDNRLGLHRRGRKAALGRVWSLFALAVEERWALRATTIMRAILEAVASALGGKPVEAARTFGPVTIVLAIVGAALVAVAVVGSTVVLTFVSGAVGSVGKAALWPVVPATLGPLSAVPLACGRSVGSAIAVEVAIGAAVIETLGLIAFARLIASLLVVEAGLAIVTARGIAALIGPLLEALLIVAGLRLLASARLVFHDAWLWRFHRGKRLHVATVGFAVILGAVVPFGFALVGAAIRVILHLRLAIGEDDAVIMFSVLEIVLGKHRVARCCRVARHGQVLLGDTCSRSRHFSVGTVALIAPGDRVLTLAIMIVGVGTVAVVVATATLATTGTSPSMLLSLPHDLPISLAVFRYWSCGMNL